MDRDRISDGIFFGVLLVTLSAVTLKLFYTQCVESLKEPLSGLFHSDMKAYILTMQGLDSGYSFPYPILFSFAALLHLFVSKEMAMALATMLLNSAACVITKLSLEALVCGRLRGDAAQRRSASADTTGKEIPLFIRLLISAVSVSLFMVSMVFPPAGIYLPGIRFTYLGVFTGNPFHNATYMAARPFAILVFVWYVKLLDSYETETSRESGKESSKELLRDEVLFSVFLLLATMAKPSFTIVLVGAAGLIMLYRLVLSGFRNFLPTIRLGLCFVPTFLDLLYQYRGVFVPSEGEEGGIGFCFGRIWSLYCDNIPLAVGLALGFPLLVLICNLRRLKTDTLFRFSWQLFAMGFLMAFFLYEKGFREPDFNFSWGYMYGIFFAFFGAAAVLIEETGRLLKRLADKKTAPKERRKTILIGAQWLAFAWHLVCGLWYFYGIFRGAMYY